MVYLINRISRKNFLSLSTQNKLWSIILEKLVDLKFVKSLTDLQFSILVSSLGNADNHKIIGNN